MVDLGRKHSVPTNFLSPLLNIFSHTFSSLFFFFFFQNHLNQTYYKTMLGTFCDKGQKCKISPNLSLGSLEMFICGESNPKFQIYNKQKANGALIREKSKKHNWNTRKCRKCTQVWNFNLHSARRENWERLWGREGRFPCTHISTPKFQNCENAG